MEADTSRIIEPDVRTAAVIWSDSTEPDIIVSGCSEYEAIGLFMRGIWSLLMMQDMDEDDEIDED